VRKWIPPVLIVLAMVASVIAYPHMAERVPTHWNMAGEVDGWSSRLMSAWLMPLMMAVILVILKLVPHIDPRKQNYEKFRGAYDAIVILILAFMLGLHVLMLAAATGRGVPFERIIPASVGAFFIVLGFILPRAHPNWFIGIRTPWTLSSDVSWERTHRLGGTLFMLTGALTLVSALIAPESSPWVLVSGGMVTVISLFIYSFIVWKREQGKGAAAE